MFAFLSIDDLHMTRLLDPY